MSLSINQFIASFKEGFAKPSLFKMFFILPPVVQFQGSTFIDATNQRRISMRCEISELPGKSINTDEHRIYGPIQKFPYSTLYDDLTVTFLCSGDMMERNIFEFWMSKVIADSNHDVEYMDNYISNLELHQFNSEGQIINIYRFIKSYPINLSPQELNWNSENEILRLQVTFAYNFWEHIFNQRI